MEISDFSDSWVQSFVTMCCNCHKIHKLSRLNIRRSEEFIVCYIGPCNHAHKKKLVVEVNHDIEEMIMKGKYEDAKTMIFLRQIENGK